MDNRKTKKNLSVVIAVIILIFSCGIIQAKQLAPAFEFEKKWGTGTYGTNPGELYYPTDVEIDSAGNLYVVDWGNHRIQKFDAAGNFIKMWGSKGSIDGQFFYPCGITFDSDGNLLVVDSYNYRIQKFDIEGNFLYKWGTKGSAEGQFDIPYRIKIDKSDNIYITDGRNNRVQIFDKNYNFVKSFGKAGSEPGQFNHPSGITIDDTGDIIVTEIGNNRIQMFDPKNDYACKWVSYGENLNRPESVLVDKNGYILVADRINNRIQVLDGSGNKISIWGPVGLADGQVTQPCGIKFDRNGKFYIADINHRVQKFKYYIPFTPLTIDNFKSLIETHLYYGQTEKHPTDNNHCVEGNIYLNITDNNIYIYKNGRWENILE
ncbi:MAG TPA: 6-bladed beta-propeller [bacterium]|nr:6-bladed beta-propeller [bacterium]